ncbi:myelin basic protein isoform X4 [Hippopotamus amphibius kiboko]|uniref:myelin basic protein isoform X4 n=1 Tax=Hippopotamus amphibius kiboko TaxID=575201 RepID=UPI0025958C4F|nr:myelin basic protein isoform X4 [Hippopotamus amphibius kiboko]
MVELTEENLKKRETFVTFTRRPRKTMMCLKHRLCRHLEAKLPALASWEHPSVLPDGTTLATHGAADVDQNNGSPLQDTAVTDSKRTADPKNAWPDANPADPGGRPHLIRLFSRDAPGREDNTFKDRPSESDELQTIQEDGAAAPEGPGVMAAQKRPSQRSKYLASASTMDHARHAFLPRHRDTGILDSLGRFFGADRGAPKRGSGKDGHHAARTTHYGSLPQKAQHGRPQDENPVVHFFKNIGAEGQKPGFGYGGRASDYKAAHKGLKGHDAQGTLSRIFKLAKLTCKETEHPRGGGAWSQDADCGAGPLPPPQTEETWPSRRAGPEHPGGA